MTHVFKICSYLPSRLYGKPMALKDPKIGPLKMINCSDSMKLRSTQKIKSLGILSWGVTHTCRGNGTLLSMKPSQAITGKVLVSHEPQRQVNLIPGPK